MKDKNAEFFKSVETELENAREQYGDVEIKDTLLKRANYYCQIGSPVSVNLDLCSG